MNKTIVDEYLFYQDKYEKVYGKKTIVFMMIGGFYEAYSTDTLGPDLSKISEITNLVKTKKDKSIAEVNKKNPYMMGFNVTALDKFLKMLVDSGFTVIIIDQVTPPPKPKRAITGIFSAGTYINNTDSKSNYIVSLYIEDEKQSNNTSYLTCIGLSAIDLTTGSCCVYEVVSTSNDEKYALDEAYRFILSYSPREVILVRPENNNRLTKDNLLAYLELSDKTIHYSGKPNKTFQKLSFQNEFFKKIYKDTGMLSPSEYLDMEKMNYARISFITLLDFAHKHNENLINDLDKPIIFNNDKHLILGNNAVYQLNIFENSAVDTGTSKFTCLFDVINNVSTGMGKRFLRNAIVEPLTDPKAIQLRYDCISEMLQDDLFMKVDKVLSSILDIERVGRKVFLTIVQPYELSNFVDSCSFILDLYKLVCNTKYIKQFCPKKQVIAELDNFVKEVNKTFDIQELKSQNMNDITGSFFKKGFNKAIDELHDKVVNSVLSMEQICAVISTYVKDNANSSPKSDKIMLKRNDQVGYYLCLTKRRADLLKKELMNHKVIKINENLSIRPDQLEFKDLPKGNTKIFFTDLEKTSDDTLSAKDKLINLIKKTFITVLTGFSVKYKGLFKELVKFISVIDFFKSGAKTAKLYGFCKPEIVLNQDKGMIDTKKLRHPIAERIKRETEYIPHDISLGSDEGIDGILLFGLNSGGKSTLSKAIGLSVIMAQAGLFVPAESYKFSPYNSVFCRITGSDNMFKGLSQFTLEMTELNAILKRNSSKTLVIGDEVCRGTEQVSGNAIIAATLIMLAESQCSFIFASHLHEVAEMARIKELKNMKICHLSVEYDKDKDELVFSRLLKDGPGSNVYGLLVAKYIIKEPTFVKLAQEIKNELLGLPNEVLTDKVSKYNSNVYIDKCQVCDKTNNKNNEFVGILDIHHINFQSECTESGFVIGKSHIKKNDMNNLVCLCKKCHHDVHHGKLIINGYKDTSKGRSLDFARV
ncbi:MAG: DNA mismatch repair ATPase [Barrevirus sp.]|uniref:DNA mismatch repair ATPase n=1 Tax=Barrevirus sp. TaxID=2487763 RepID=A0A3G4ZU54_9VIRU|nr:MAG: DNA mismatch repair ATPase [Barrevirus sp.]